MKRWCMVAGMFGTICLVAGIGCNGASSEKAETSAEVKQLRTALEESQQQKTQLQGDVTRLQESLKQAESGLAAANKAGEEFQEQIQGLSTSRTALEARVSDLDKARADLATKVEQLTGSRDQLQQRVEELVKSRDDLQTMVASLVDTRGTLEKQVAALTKSRNAALEDAKKASSGVFATSNNGSEPAIVMFRRGAPGCSSPCFVTPTLPHQ